MSNSIIDKSITLDNIISYLMERKLIDAKSIVNDNLKIIDSSRRNRIFQVRKDDGGNLVIKQPRLTDINNLITIRNEALLYLLVRKEQDFAILKGIMPEIIDFDEERSIMITELIEDTRTVNDNHARWGELRREELESLGRAMAIYHRVFSEYMDKLKFIKYGFIPAATIIRPTPGIFVDIKHDALKLLKMIQEYPVFNKLVDDLSSSWEYKTLIHGDIKLDNILIKDDTSIRIIDWEGAMIGDPAWDIGSIFQEFIKLYMYIQPSRDTIGSKDIQSMIRIFWNSYLRSNQLNASESNQLLIKSTKFCAARLLQSAYELVDSYEQITDAALYMIQMSMNIFNRVEDATIHLLGIPFRCELI